MKADSNPAVVAGVEAPHPGLLALERMRRLLNFWHALAEEIPPACETEKERRTYRIIDAAVTTAILTEADKVRAILDSAGQWAAADLKTRRAKEAKT